MDQRGEMERRRRGLTGEERGLLVALALVAAVAGVFLAAPRVQRVMQQRVVIRACDGAVMAQLKAPSTASFPRPSDWTAPREGLVPLVNGAKVHGWAYTVVVDAQNGFGATLRARFRCDYTTEFGVTATQE